MKTEFHVSVVIPTHNRCAALLSALRSVLAQEWPATEIIVVDDASTDETAQIDFQALDGRVKYVRHERNRGGAVARNTGIEHASGNWIAFLDSDDLWLPEKLRVQREQVLRSSGGDIFLCSNAWSRKSDGSQQLFNARSPAIGENLSEYFLVEGCSFQTSTLLIPAPVLKQTRFDESLHRHQDWDLVLRLVQAGVPYVYTHEPLAVYTDSSDDTRISRQKDPGPTLYWFNLARSRVSSAAAAYLYSYLYFPRHFRRQSVEALKVVANLATRDLRAFRFACRALLRRSAEEIRHAATVNVF